MIGWHLNGHEFQQTQGNREGQGTLACCTSWSRKKSDTTQQLNNDNHPLKLERWYQYAYFIDYGTDATSDHLN